MKLLYVEDNPFDRDLTRRVLLKQLPGLEWDAVPSAREAIARIDARMPEVLLLDMWLQDGCGLEVLLDVRRRGLPIVVVVVAGAGDEASVIRFLKAGAQDYLPKHGDYLDRLGERLQQAQRQFRENLRPRSVLTVLYVESSPDDIELTRHHFERRAPHLDLVALPDGPAALAWLEAPGNRADVALLDLRLPGMSGLELLPRLQAGYGLPCLVITGRGDEADAAQAMHLGATGYLIKEHGYIVALPHAIEHAHVLAAYTALRQAGVTGADGAAATASSGPDSPRSGH